MGEPVTEVATRDQLDVWLAMRNLGAVPVADAAAFSWAGHWIAITSGDRAVQMYGQPSGALDGDLAVGESIVGGLVIAPRDLQLDLVRERRSGVVEAVYVAAEREGPVEALTTARAIAGAGLEGDRYVSGAGTFSSPGSPGHHLTLIDADVLDAVGVTGADARRNIVTRGVDLDAAIGREFRIGDVVCRGHRRAEPCAHLQRLAGPGVLRALVHRGGLRADIITDGAIVLGDSIVIGDSFDGSV